MKRETLCCRLEKLADANRQRVIMEAEAEAEALRLRGEAEAFAIQAKAKAEAEQMAKKAEAFKEYREAAMVEMLLNTLPKVTGQVALTHLLHLLAHQNTINCCYLCY